MSEYNIIRADLINVDLNFSEYKEKRIESIKYSDYLEVSCIDGNQIILLLGRKVHFLPSEIIRLDAKFKVELRTNSCVNLEKLKKDVKEGILLLNSVYSKISLVIAELTDATIFGPLVTPPVYDKDQIVVK